MSIEIKNVGEASVLCVPKRFDAYTASLVDAELSRLITEGKSKIVCDFSQTEYLASAGLRVLLSASKRLQRTGGKMALCAVKSYVLEVFEISGFDKIFQIYPKTEDAAKALT